MAATYQQELQEHRIAGLPSELRAWYQHAAMSGSMESRFGTLGFPTQVSAGPAPPANRLWLSPATFDFTDFIHEHTDVERTRGLVRLHVRQSTWWHRTK